MSALRRPPPRPRPSWRRSALVAAVVTALAAVSFVASTRWQGTETAAAATPTFSFGVAGDFGQTDGTTGGALSAVASSGTNMMFAIGDFSYNGLGSEPSWCDYVKSRVGADYPFELLSGNHESYPRDGYYVNYDACLPDHLGVTGAYGQEYYVDWPPANPLVRFIMISPNLQYGDSKSTATTWSYKSTTGKHYVWTKDAIEEAKARGEWVVVGMHEYCTSMVPYPCVVGNPIMDLILSEKVDLLFQAHDHAYARTDQVTVGQGSCTSFAATSFNPDCVADPATNVYSRGAGTVVTTVGSGGKNMNKEDPTVAQAPYFVAWQGSNNNATWGFSKVDVSPSQLSVSFVRGAGGSFTDTYTITGSAPATSSSATSSSATSSSATSSSATSSSATATTTAPTTTATTTTAGTTTATTTTATTTTATSTSSGTGPATLAPVADSYVVSNDPAGTTHGSETALYSVNGSPSKISYLKFDLTGVTGTVSDAALSVTTTSSSWSGSPSPQNLYVVPDSSWTEGGLTWADRPGLGTPLPDQIPANSTGNNTTYTVPIPASALQPYVGSQVTLAIQGAKADAFYVNSREAAANGPQLTVTTG